MAEIIKNDEYFEDIVASGDFAVFEDDDFLDATLYDCFIDEYKTETDTKWEAAKLDLMTEAEKRGKEIKKRVAKMLPAMDRERRAWIKEEKEEKIRLEKEKKEAEKAAQKAEKVRAEQEEKAAREAKKEAERAAKKAEEGYVPARLEGDENPFMVSEKVRICENFDYDENGIWAFAPDGGVKLICYTPMIVTGEYIRESDGKTLYGIKWIRWENGKKIIQEKRYPAEVISDKNAINKALSQDGIHINSNHAAAVSEYLIEYIACLEKKDLLQREKCVQHFGWVDHKFIPYEDGGAVFCKGDDDYLVAKPIESVKGDPEKYIEHMRGIRTMGRLEINFTLAATMASFMLGEYVQSISFMVHLFGEPNTLKTFSERYGASQYGEPTEGGLIKDWRGTKNGVTALAATQYNIPLILDDTSKVPDYGRKDIESTVYALCGNSQKLACTRDGGVRAAGSWNMVIISSGEAPISSYCRQGGGIARVLEIEAKDKIPFTTKQSQDEITFLANNHGHVIRPFLAALKELGQDGVDEIFNEIHETVSARLDESRKIDHKQIQPFEIVLIADKILTDYIYKDGVYLTDRLDELIEMLKKEDDIAEGKRAFDALRDAVAANRDHFYFRNIGNTGSSERPAAEQWGWYTPDNPFEINIMNTCLKEIAKKYDFDYAKLLAWMLKHNITTADKNGQQPNQKLPWRDNFIGPSAKGLSQRAWRINLSPILTEEGSKEFYSDEDCKDMIASDYEPGAAINAGDKFRYRITVENTKNSNNADIFIRNKLCEGVRLIEASDASTGRTLEKPAIEGPEADTEKPRDISWHIAGVRYGEVITVEFAVEVLENHPSKITCNNAYAKVFSFNENDALVSAPSWVMQNREPRPEELAAAANLTPAEGQIVFPEFPEILDTKSNISGGGAAI